VMSGYQDLGHELVSYWACRAKLASFRRRFNTARLGTAGASCEDA
jgi:hypothetical protein